MRFDRELFVLVVAGATLVVLMLAIVMYLENRALFVHVFALVTLACVLFPVWRQLRTGEVRVSLWPDRRVRRKDEPVRYWMRVAWGLIFAGIMMWLVVSLFTAHVEF